MARQLKPGESGVEESDYYDDEEIEEPLPTVQRSPPQQPTGPLPPVQNPNPTAQFDPGGEGWGILDPGKSQGKLPDFNVPQAQPGPGMQLPGPDDATRAFEDAIRNQILGLIQSSQQPVNADEINASPEARAYRRISEREMQGQRARMAEQLAARGQGQNQFGEQGGALQSGIQGGGEQLAERMQAMESQMVAKELMGRRQQLMDALRLGAGILSQDEQGQLQRELAALDNQLRRELGFADINLRGQLGGGQLSLGLLQTLLGNQQFYDKLGFDVGDMESLFNQNAMRFF
jgi:hypothetical protein